MAWSGKATLWQCVQAQPIRQTETLLCPKLLLQDIMYRSGRVHQLDLASYTFFCARWLSQCMLRLGLRQAARPPVAYKRPVLPGERGS